MRIFQLFLILFFTFNSLYAFEKEASIVKLDNSNFCKIYKHWILKFHLNITDESPEGGEGSKIFLKKRTPKNSPGDCKSLNTSLAIDASEMSFLGISNDYVFLRRYKSAPGFTRLSVYSTETSNLVRKIVVTVDRPIEAKEKKLIFWESKKRLKGDACRDLKEKSELGCEEIQKIEMDINTGKKHFIGHKELIPVF
ncbi:MAG: hypothetical protein KDD50_15895 [Bdellovibrionales bacterium]|nr:hypothetical protein [Bdellovibrionales bacterium]MCB0415821.1 hypothetical protein [Bdellovibrionales bacterium]